MSGVLTLIVSLIAIVGWLTPGLHPDGNTTVNVALGMLMGLVLYAYLRFHRGSSGVVVTAAKRRRAGLQVMTVVVPLATMSSGLMMILGVGPREAWWGLLVQAGVPLLTFYAAMLTEGRYETNFRPCPACEATISKTAKVCRHCGREVPSAAQTLALH